MKEREEAERVRKEKLANDAGSATSLITSPAPTPTPAAVPGPGPGPTSPPLADIRSTLGGIGSGIGSFFGSRVASIRGTGGTPPAPVATPEKRGLRPMSLTPSASTSAGKDRSVSGSAQP